MRAWAPKEQTARRSEECSQALPCGRSQSGPTTRLGRRWIPRVTTYRCISPNWHCANQKRWDWLKGRLQEFGNQAGLFTEIEVHRLGKIESAPFQIRIRKSGKRRKGPFRNLVDMGCGLSQALPIITELLRHDGPRLMLLQQPEAHLHPGAAAALASLFCETVANSEHGRQIVVETHSDFIIDRVRTSVRDRAAGIQPEDVSILYFERNEQAVNIHSISVDRLGNIDGAPVGDRRFFMDELRRSISA